MESIIIKILAIKRKPLRGTHAKLELNIILKQWEIGKPIIAIGNDIFIVTNAKGETTNYIFSEGEYGKRVCALNIYNDGDNSYMLGVYHVSGATKDGTGFYVVPGGNSSNTQGSNNRIKDTATPLPILAPYHVAKYAYHGNIVYKLAIQYKQHIS